MSRRRLLRFTLLACAAGLVLALLVTAIAGVVLVRRPFPDEGAEVSLQGLDSTVTVRRDDLGIPQIYADTAADLFRAQGYVQAQDRFFEMDWRRHVTAGRLSELVGPNAAALQADKVVRTLGWRRVAQAELDQSAPATRRALDAFALGVNDYLRSRSASYLSINYTLLGVNHSLPMIEPWSPVDSISWFKAMAWDLRGNYDDEMIRARAYGAVHDVQRVQQLFPPYPYATHAPILSNPISLGAASNSAIPATTPRATVPVTVPVAGRGAPAGHVSRAPGTAELLAALRGGAAQDAVAEASAALHAVPTLLGGSDGVGSNSWVISGKLTASGKPLLANDPHLSTQLPGIWYQMGLHCRKLTADCPYDVAGFTFSGVPGVVIGHTNRFGWGITNLGPDVTDFYLEKLTADGYQVDGKTQPLTSRTESILVTGGAPVTLTVRSTRHGPLLSDVLDTVAAVGAHAPVAKGSPPPNGPNAGDDPNGGYGVSLAWTALTPGHDMDAILAVDSATDFRSFRAAVLLMDVPAQNFVYADVDGHIGYQAPGRIPLRPGAGTLPGISLPGTSGGAPGTASGSAGLPTDGSWPLPGWTTAYDWNGFVAPADLPWVLDPPEGFIVAANQPVTSPAGPVHFTDDFDYGYRSQRIRDLITTAVAQNHKLQASDLAAIQADTRNGLAPDLVKLLLKIKINDPYYADAVELLRGWDFTQSSDSAAAAYFNAVWASLLDLTFADELPAGTRPNGGGRWFAVVQTLLANPQDPWWDDHRTPNVVETRDEVLRQALMQARDRLTRILGKEPSRWQWGRLHRLRLVETPLGDVAATSMISPLLNRGPIEMPGGSALVDAVAWDAASGSFDVTTAPSMRMIVDFSALDQSRWVNETGESGHPGNAHYADQLDAWSHNRSYPWPFSPTAVEAATAATMTLRPVATSP